METITHVIGVMDPNSLSFRYSFEQLMKFLAPEIQVGGKLHRIETRRIKSRPYNTLGATSTCRAIINRGAHWNPHHNSFFMMITHQVYLLNDMTSFKAIDKNAAYGQMHDLGMRIPKTWAIPQRDYSEIEEAETVELDLVFDDFEMFDLAEIGRQVGYPAYLKPQDGGGWVDVSRVENEKELLEAYAKSGAKPMNLQQSVDYREFVRTVGVGPQMMPMHYNASAEFSHDRYLRSATQAVDHHFLTPREHAEVCKLTKIINAFYGWDHNSCETLIDKKTNLIHPIDFANAYPDSKLTSLHFYFPELVKAMVRWLLFVAVTGKEKPIDFGYTWRRYFEVRDRAKAEDWDYQMKIDAYAALADRHFSTEEFEHFVAKHLQWLEEKAYRWFASPAFDTILEEEVKRHFKIPLERPAKLAHYKGIHNHWLHCEKERLGL